MEVQPVAKLGRYNDLEESLVTGALPFVELCSNVEALVGSIESSLRSLAALRRALAGHVSSVRLPLPRVLVCRVADPDGNSLIEGSVRTGIPACTLYAPC